MVKVYEDGKVTEYTAEEWYGVACEEAGIEQDGFESFEEVREFVESNETLMNADKFTITEHKNGNVKVHEYFKIVM